MSRAIELLRDFATRNPRGVCGYCGLQLRTRRQFCSEECFEASRAIGHAGKVLIPQAARHRQRESKQTVTLPRISIQSEQAMTELYNFKSAGHPGAYVCTKFDEHLNVQSTYLLDHGECACPRGQQGHSQCRHRKMIGIFKQAKHIDDGWLFDWHTRQWSPPTVNHDLPELPEADEDGLEKELVNDGDITDDLQVPTAPTVDEEPSAGLPEAPPPASTPQAAQSRPTVGAPLLRRRAVR